MWQKLFTEFFCLNIRPFIIKNDFVPLLVPPYWISRSHSSPVSDLCANLVSDRSVPFSPCVGAEIVLRNDSRAPEWERLFCLCRNSTTSVPDRVSLGRLSHVSISLDDFETIFSPKQNITRCNYCKTVKRFCVLTCTSLSLRLVAIWLRSVRLRYFLAWNSRSNSSSCSDVKAVRRLRDLDDPPFELFLESEGLFEPPVPSSEHSLSDGHKSEMENE